MTFPRSFRLLLPIVLLAVVSVVYWPGLAGGFIFDDFANVQTNPRIQMQSLDAESLSKAARAYEPGAYGRPLATLTLALDYYIHREAPRGYKVTNLAIHLLNTLLVLLLSRKLLALPRSGGAWSEWAPIAIAAAWAVHPLHISTVLYIVQRMELLAATFVLLAMVAYVRGRLLQIDGSRGSHWLVFSAILAGIGMLSKESAILFPGFALALELTLLRFDAWSPRTSLALRWAYGVSCVVALAVFLGYIVPKFASAESYAGRDFTLYERLLTQLRVLPMYLGQSLFPLPDSLKFYYDAYPKSTGWLSPWTTLAGAAFLLALAAITYRWIRTAPLAAFGILWFFIAHSLTSGPLNLELVFEHRNYLALFGVVLAVADGVRRIPMRDGPALKVFAVVVVLIFFAAFATLRSATWSRPLLLASDLVARSPESPRASNDLAMTYVGMSGNDKDSPFLYMGMQEFERGSRLPGASPLPEQGLILMAAVSGYPVDPAWWDRMLAKVRTQPIGPEQMMSVMGLMTQHQRGYRVDAARLAEVYQALLDRGDWPGHVYASFADFVLADIGDEAWAQRLYVESVACDPTDAEFANLLFSTLVAERKVRHAGAVWDKMLELGIPVPGDSTDDETSETDLK